MKKCTPIENLPISKRVKNSLYFIGRIETLEQLKEKSDQELLRIRGIGKKGLEEIHKVIK